MLPNYQFLGDGGAVTVEGVYGLVLSASGTYDHIQRVNVREYKSWCRRNRVHPTHGDILLVGYWYDDEGDSWSAPRLLLSYEGATDGGYPSSSQREDGTIVTVYYSNRIPNHHRYHMGVVRWQAAE